VKESFPSTGFESGISGLPRMSYSHIWKYLIDDVEIRKQLATEKPIVKGYNFFKSGHVLQIFSKKENSQYYVKSKVLPSMIKKKIYTVNVIIKPSGDIAKAMCGCPAGVDGRCNHLSATLFAIEDKFSKGNGTGAEHDSHNQTSDIPCTSKPCSWNVPSRKRKLEPQPIQSVKFEKHEFGKKVKHSPREHYDVRASHQRTVNSDDQKRFYEKVKEIEKSTGKRMALSLILPHDLPDDTSNSVNSGTLENPDPDECLWKLTSPNKTGPLSLDDIARKAERVNKRLFDSSKNCTEIECKTRDQHNSMLWYSVRKPRITASKTKRCLQKETTSPTKAISEILMYKPNIQTSYMKEGIEMEPKIIERFSEETGHIVKKCGFFISESHPLLGASPDGITEEGNLIEVKKVTSKEGEAKDDTLCRLGIYYRSGANILINRKHKYHYQIQQQLFCADKKLCHFIISNGTWLHTELVEFDSSSWNTIVSKLQDFYFTNIFPELVYPRVLYGQQRWNKTIPFPRLSE